MSGKPAARVNRAARPRTPAPPHPRTPGVQYSFAETSRGSSAVMLRHVAGLGAGWRVGGESLGWA